MDVKFETKSRLRIEHPITIVKHSEAVHSGDTVSKRQTFLVKLLMHKHEAYLIVRRYFCTTRPKPPLRN